MQVTLLKPTLVTHVNYMLLLVLLTVEWCMQKIFMEGLHSVVCGVICICCALFVTS